MMIIYNKNTGQHMTDSNAKRFANWYDCIKDSYEAWPRFNNFPDWMGHRYIQYYNIENEKVISTFVGCPSKCAEEHVMLDHF